MLNGTLGAKNSIRLAPEESGKGNRRTRGGIYLHGAFDWKVVGGAALFFSWHLKRKGFYDGVDAPPGNIRPFLFELRPKVPSSVLAISATSKKVG